MSFLKNLRSTISRKNSVRSKNVAGDIEKTDFPRGSDKKSVTKDKENPEEIKSECVLRSDTFTIIDESGNVLIKEETAGVEIKRSEHKMFSKFGTFSRKKKNKAEKKNLDSNEQSTGWYKIRHDSENAVSSKSPVNDPFNILYQQSAVPSKTPSASIEYATYRKNKLLDSTNEKSENSQLESKSTERSREDPDKYKTVTLKSFRKSFRDRFLAQQKDVPYNPAWFIEVEQPVTTKKDEESDQEVKQRELLVFENENYRPTARSPIRNIDRSPSRSKTPVRSPSRKLSDAKPESRSRSSTRSSNRRSKESTHADVGTSHHTSGKPAVTVKRNETFKIERGNLEPSIRIEIRNSISPNEPGRIVPVGVAKPMVPSSSDASRKTNAERSDRYLMDQNHRSRSSNVKKNYQTKIHITPSASGHHTSISSHQQERGDNKSNRLAMSSKCNAAAKSAIQVPHKRSKPIVENYLPLTSYELLTKIRPRPNVGPDKSVISGKSQSLRHGASSSSSHNSKSLDKPTTFDNARKQKTSIYIGDNPVRKDFASNQSDPNKRRIQIKIPWR